MFLIVLEFSLVNNVFGNIDCGVVDSAAESEVAVDESHLVLIEKSPFTKDLPLGELARVLEVGVLAQQHLHVVEHRQFVLTHLQLQVLFHPLVDVDARQFCQLELIDQLLSEETEYLLRRRALHCQHFLEEFAHFHRVDEGVVLFSRGLRVHPILLIILIIDYMLSPDFKVPDSV